MVGVLLGGGEGRGEVAQISPVGRFTHPQLGVVTGVDVSGNKAYLASTTGLWVVDIANPERPTPHSSYLAEGATAVGVDGGRAFLALRQDGNPGGKSMLTLDVSGAAPVVAGEFSRLGSLMGGVDVSVAGGRALLVGASHDGLWNLGVRAFNLFDVDEISSVAIRPTGAVSDTRMGIAGHMVEAGGDYLSAVVTDHGLTLAPGVGGEGAMRHLALAEGASAVFLAPVGLEMCALVAFAERREVRLFGVVAGPGGSRTAEARSVFSTGGRPLGLFVADGYCFVAADRAGVEIYRLDPRHGRHLLVGSLETGGRARRLKVAGDLIHVAEGEGGYRVLRWSSDTLPNEAPVVALAAELVDGVASGRVVLAAEAADGDGEVLKVEFYDGVRKLGEDVEAPYGLEVAGFAPGPHVLTARAVDDRGGVGVSPAVSAGVPYPPRPQGQIEFNNRKTGMVDARVFLPGGVQGAGAGMVAELWLGRSWQIMELVATTSFRTTSAAAMGYVNALVVAPPGYFAGEWVYAYMRVWDGRAGSYINAQRRNALYGQSSLISVVLTAPPDAPAPMVGLYAFTLGGLNPPNVIEGLMFTSFTLSTPAANLGDELVLESDVGYFYDEPRVVKVEYFDGETKLGEVFRDTTATRYSLAVSNLAVGTHQIRAVATGSDGATKEAGPRTFTVLPANSPPGVGKPSLEFPTYARGQTLRLGTSVVSGLTTLPGGRVRIYDSTGAERSVFEYASWSRGQTLAFLGGVGLEGPLGTWSVTHEVTGAGGAVGKSIPLAFTLVDSIPLGQALDAPHLSFTTAGERPWVGRPTYSQDLSVGGSQAESGHVGDGGRSELGTTVVGPGRLTFAWGVSSEREKDFLEFRIAGQLMARISGEPALHDFGCDIPEGPHQITWVYVKDAAGAAGRDAGLVDNVRFAPQVVNTPPRLSALPNKRQTAGVLWRHQLVGIDAETAPEQLVYSLGSHPPGLSLTSGGLLSWRPDPLDAGTYPVNVIVSDGQLTANAWFDLTVARPNQPPVVVLAGPAGPIALGQAATLAAAVSDADGVVAKVEFLRGEERIGVDTLDPFALVVGNLGVGTHWVAARATDDMGGVATSARVAVEVVAPEGAARLALAGPGRLSITGLVGRSYVVEMKGDLREEEWQVVGVVRLDSETQEYEAGGNPMGAARYYRVVLVE